MANDLIDITLLSLYDKRLKTVSSILQRATSYVKGDIVHYNGKYMRCTVAGTSSVDRLTALDTANVGDSVVDGTVTWKVFDPFTGGAMFDWQSSKSYNVGDLVVYNDLIYRCIVSNSDVVFTSSNWSLIGSRGVTNWEPNKTYSVNNLVMHESELYICIANNTSTTNFEDDVASWLKLSSASGSGYKQINKLDIKAPQSVEITINKTKTFALPPVEVLKLDKGETDVIQNQFDFSAGDGSKFEIDGVVAKNSPYIIFDGTVRPNHTYSYKLGDATKMVSGYYLESEEVDFSKFKVIDGVSLT